MVMSVTTPTTITTTADDDNDDDLGRQASLSRVPIEAVRCTNVRMLDSRRVVRAAYSMAQVRRPLGVARGCLFFL